MVNGDVDGGAPSDYRREGSGYPSDLRDAEWARLAPLLTTKWVTTPASR